MKMKKFAVFALSALLVIGTILTVGCAPAETITPEVSVQQVEDVSALEANMLIQENLDNPDFVILDVRTAEEYSEGHIGGAVNLDFYNPDFRNRLDELDKEMTYLLHCRSGTRSGNSLDIMRELGFTSIYHMIGGIIEWDEEGLSTEK